MRESEPLMAVKKSKTILASATLSLGLLLVACSTSEVEKGSSASTTISMTGERSSYTSSQPTEKAGTEGETEAEPEENDNLFVSSTSPRKTTTVTTVTTVVEPSQSAHKSKTDFAAGYKKVNPENFKAYHEGLYAFNYSFGNSKVSDYCVMDESSVTCTGVTIDELKVPGAYPPFDKANSLTLRSDNTWHPNYLEGWSPFKEQTLKAGESISVSEFTCILSEEYLFCKSHKRERSIAISTRGYDRQISLIMD